MLLELLQPFSDAIHQLEADRPLLGQCYLVVTALHKHVEDSATKHKDKRDGEIIVRLEETFQRRYNATGGGARAPIYNDAYAAAYVLDPYYAETDAEGTWYPPAITTEELKGVVTLVERVGGINATRELHKLLLMGYPPSMSAFVACIADPKAKLAAAVDDDASNKKRKIVAIPNMASRLKIWVTYGQEPFSHLVDVVHRLLCCHATTCATERNWSLWGRVYTSSRNRLGIERAKKMIAICTNTKQRSGDDFAVALAVIDGNI